MIQILKLYFLMMIKRILLQMMNQLLVIKYHQIIMKIHLLKMILMNLKINLEHYY